jgi:hypothetical protein
VSGTFQCWGRLLKIELIINKVINQVINNLSIDFFSDNQLITYLAKYIKL